VIVSKEALFWGTSEDVPFLRPLRKGEIYFYQDNFSEELERHVKEGSGNG
jgi:hypothetical protein